MNWLLAAYIVATQATYVLAATPSQWQNQIIYQLLTDRFAQTNGSTTVPCNVSDRAYCGGTWQGIINKFDYIQNMGFTAIWISPVTSQTPINGSPTGTSPDGSSYHGYWQDDLYALNSNFGTTDDLKELSDAIHQRGMYLMVDVVANHFGWPGSSNSVDYSTYNPFNNKTYFHPFCQITQQDYNDNNQTAIDDCWLGDSNYELVDVDTDSETVQNIYNTWISELVSNYSIDGLRIDTVKNVQQSFWPKFNKAAGVYCVGEVDNGNPDYVCPYQNYLDGVLNYPLYYPLTQAFQSTSGNISALTDMVNTLKSTCKNTTLLGSFMENQDNPRFPSLTSDVVLDENAIAFTLLADGVPIIYEGQEQHYGGGNDPYNREAIWSSNYSTTSPLYVFITKLNQLRKFAIKQDPNYVQFSAASIYNDSSSIAMVKGSDGNQVVGVFNNQGSSAGNSTLQVPGTGFISGQVITEILSCTNVKTNENGTIMVPMNAGAPRIFYLSARLNGSGICGY